MIPVLKPITALMAALVLGAAGRAFALNTNPDVVEPGDVIRISVPFRTLEGGNSPMRNVRLAIANIPAWVELDTTTSYVGPVDIYPGERVVLYGDFIITGSYNPQSPAASIILNLLSDSTSFVPSGITWTFTTDNGFKTSIGACMANDGIPCGDYAAPDSLPPNTYLVFAGPYYELATDRIFLSSTTLVSFVGADAYENNATISRAAITGYAIDAQPASFDALNFSTMPVPLAMGVRTLYYASRDYAGNTEVIRSTTVIVDGTAPGHIVDLKADGELSVSPWKNVREFNLAWTNPPDDSGIGGVRLKFGGTAPYPDETGVLYPPGEALLYSSTAIINGANVVRLWLEDNVGNAAPGNAERLTLRYDDMLPISTASAVALSSSSVLRVGFWATDALSGVAQTVLWWQNNGMGWSSGTYSQAGDNGTFAVNTAGIEGNWGFYTQSFDYAGNAEPAPISTTTPKASAFVDTSSPIISNVQVSGTSNGSVRVSWKTDDEATGVLEYGDSAGPERQTREVPYSTSQSLVLGNLLYPANYAFRITVTNKTGISNVYAGGAFYVPPQVTTNINDFGVLPAGQPIVVEVTNPNVSSITYSLNGTIMTQVVTPGIPVQIYTPATSGQTNLSFNLGDYSYSTSFIVDPATRTVRLARVVVDAGGVMSLPSTYTAVDATVGQVAQEEMSNSESMLFLGYYASIDPVAPAAISTLSVMSGQQPGQISLAWSASGDDAGVGTAMRYEIRYSSAQISSDNFKTAVLVADIPRPAKAGTVQTLVISGLENGTTYYFAIKTIDELLNWSFSDVPGIKTLEVARSTALISGAPAVEVISNFSNLSILQISTSTVETAFRLALDTAPGQGLVFYGDVYDINPSQTFTEDVQLIFRYTDPGDAAAEDALDIYKYSPEQGKWVPLNGVRDVTSNVIRAITHSFSLYAVFGRDTTPPVSTAIMGGGVRYSDMAGNIYISGETKLSLSAWDAGAGMARSEYRLDTTAGPYIPYSGPVEIGEGWHTLHYRSVDKAGNTENPKSLFLMKDALAPRVELTFDGAFSRLPGGVIHISSTSGGVEIVTLDQPASGSGLKSVRLELDGAVSDVSSQHNVALTMGRHDIVVRAEDNVGNVTEQRTEVVVGDLLPPVISAPANNFAASQSTITFSWQHQTTNFFSLTEYDLMIGAEPGFATPEFTQVVSSHVKVTLLISEAGVTVEGLEAYGGALRLVTEQMPDQWTGALEGVMVTPNISLPPNTTGISNFTVTQSTNAGSIDHEYRFQAFPFTASSYYPIVTGGGRDFDMTSGGWVAFRSTLRRNALTEASPTLTKIEFTVNYVVVNWQRVCYKPCWGCSYVCNYQAVVTPYNYQTGIQGVSAVSHEGLRISSSGAVELVTEPGALTGTWLSQAYQVPDTAYRIGDLQPDYDSNGGSISFEFSKSSGAFRPIAELESVNFRTGDTIQFKATLSRFTSSDNSPVFRRINFNFIAPPPTGTEFALPVERKYYWRVAAKDYLGRYSAPSAERLIIYDTKPPLTEHLLNGATGQGGWLVSPVSVTLVSTDAVAGVGGIYYSVDGSSFARYASPFLMAAEGARVLRYYSADTVGNKEAEKSLTAKIDLSSPAITAAVSPSANAYGWNNAPVGVVFTGSDTVSGLAYCSSSATVFGEGAGREVHGECYDNAGLTSTTAVVVSIDATAPTVQYTRSPAANDFGWNSGTVTVKFACADALSGVRVCPPDLALAAEGANISTAAVALDFAGNSSSIVAEGIRIDRTPPASVASLTGTFKNGWYSTPVTVTLASTDSLSGVSQAMYSQDEAAFAAYQQPVSVTGDGAHTVKYYASDKAGNAEPQKSVAFSIDRTGPQVSFVVVPAPNAYGWNNGPLTVLYIGTDTLSGVDICPARGVAAEGAGQNAAGWCRDRVGNVAYSTAIVNVDLSSPTVRAIQNPVPNEAGWNNGSVTVIFSGEDALSGIAGCSPDKVVSLEGVGQGVTGSCGDKAGNASYSTRYVSIDKTAPLSSATLSGTMSNGWYNSGVLITITSTDTLSGIGQVYYRLERAGVLLSSGNYTGPVLAGTDGLYAAYYYGVDRAGNAETEKSAVFGIDRTSPQVNYTLSPPPNAAGWNNTAVQLVFSGTDTLSGISECSSATVAAAGLARALAGWCRDAAGNIGYATATLNIDLTAPVATATQAPPRNSYGWNNSTVTVAFSGADDISAVSYCTPGITVAAEASGQVVSGYCNNYAGLSSTASLTVSIDRSFPLSRLFLDGVIVATGSANLYMRPGSSLTIVSGEPPIASQSGVAFTTFTVTQYSPSGWTTIAGGIYSDPLVPQQEGLYTLYYNAIDKADNWEPQRKRQVYVDTTAPVTTPYMDGVKVTSSTIMFVRPGTAISLAAADPLSNNAASGVDFTTYTITKFIPPDWVTVDAGNYTVPIIAGGEEGHFMVYFQSRDKAGNWEPKRRREGYLDVTPPVIIISSPAAGQTFVATRGKINIGFGVTDNLDPAPAFSAFLEQVTDKGSPRGSRPARVPVVNGQAIEPLDIDDGSWQLTVSATDFANNSATALGGTFEVVHDMLPPRTAQSVSGGPLYQSGGSLYIRKDTVLKLTSADDLVQAGDGVGLGVKSQSASISDREWAFVNSDPRQGGVYISTLTLDSQTDGFYSLRYSALDVLGNAEAVKTSTLAVDNTAPIISSQLEGFSGDNGWHISTVTISLSAADLLSGVSGVFYRLDGATGDTFSLYTGSSTVSAEGEHMVLSYASDNLGNTSAQSSRSFRIDRTVPVVSKVMAPVANQDGWHNGAVTVTFSGSDTVSGLAYCEPAKTTYVEGMDIEVSGYCRDYAGLSSTVPARFNVDLTSPTINIERSPLANAYGWNNSDVTVAFTCLDSLSGIKVCPPEKVFGSEGAGQGTSGVAADYADNLSSASIAGINIDKTSPETLLSITGDIWQAAGKKFLSPRSMIALAAADPASSGTASGVEAIEYRLGDGVFSAYVSSFSLAEGLHSLAFRARDKAGNIELSETAGFNVDGTAPVTEYHIGNPYHAADGVNHITPATPVTFTAVDPVANAVASGLNRIEVSVNGAAFGAYSAALKLPEGKHIIRFRAIDNVGNIEAERTLAVQSDNTAPVSGFVSSGQYFEVAGKNYAPLGFAYAVTAVDPVANNVASGVKFSEYRIDGGEFNAFNSAFSLSEGIRLVEYRSYDNVLNAEVLKSAAVNVDNTVPQSSLVIDQPKYEFAGSVYVSSWTLFRLSSVDPVARGVASGVKNISYRFGTAPFGQYAAAFNVPMAEGDKVIEYIALDNVGNSEGAKSQAVKLDATAPGTLLKTVGGMQHAGPEAGSFYASLGSRFDLVAVDPVTGGVASGVKRTSWSDNGGAEVDTVSGLVFGEGRHPLTYRSMDNVDNLEVIRSTTILVDNTAPVTAYHIGTPYHAANGVNYITPATQITFTAADVVVNAVASGLNRIEVSVDGAIFSTYSAALKLAEGRHILKFHAVDNVGNVEAEKTLEVQSDATPPVSKWLVSAGEWKELSGRFYINALGKIALESADPVVADVAAGLEGIYYGIDASPAGKYAAPFGLAEGIRTISFSAKDNVSNTEVAKSTAFYVDGTKPESSLSISGDRYKSDKVYISMRSEVLISADDPIVSDVASGVRWTKYAADSGALASYERFKLATEGKRTIAFYSADQVGNTEAAKTAELWVDATPPLTALSVVGARHDADGLVYITKDSAMVLTPADPVSAETASGIMLAKYRIDGGDWQVYSGSFTITTEGRHTLEYYSIDRVQNAEAIKSAALAVDNTSPATTVSLGEPKFYAFGLPVLSPDTPITLMSADLVSGGVAAGLRQIYYEVINVASGVPVRYNYMAPFKLPQGTYDLRYWAADNVANVETYKQVRLAVSTYQNDSLQAVDGLDMSGTADIAGAVRSNAVVSVSGNARILGDVAASTITLSGKAQITGQQTSGLAALSPEPIYLGAIPDIPVSTVPAGYMVGGRLVVNSKTKLSLSTGTYRFNGIELAGGSEISINGKVEILVSGDVSIGGGSSLNSAGLASDLSIFVNTVSSVSFAGGGNLVAKVYAPMAHLKLAGNAMLGGHYFVRTAAVSGTGNLLQAGETIPQTTTTTGDSGGKKKASAFAAESYSVLSGPDPAFKLGEVYVFPNPAKGGEVPIFHVETGMADSVKITVYTVSGRQAHETTLTGMPAALDDGNGLSYAYEYAWRGYIPSGVYYYHIEAVKSGQKLKKNGKFSVVR